MRAGTPGSCGIGSASDAGEGAERKAMSDRMHVLPFADLVSWILSEYEENGSIFGIPRELFYVPQDDAPFATTLFGEPLATPIGPAAGPHTQLTQNILSAWLVGGRFIELKTVQIMDELEIPRPCIDMEDEGYNVEWSQELKLEQSLQEYVKAWVLVHLLQRLLGFEAAPLGTIFNMSVGYNLEGILSDPMQRFMDRLEDASAEIEALQKLLQDKFPQFVGIDIPPRIVRSVTVSTMHGCPPNEIEKIARYLIEERGLHTTIKLNPTLLGQQRVTEILHERLGFDRIVIPDAVFEHDLRYDRALELIRSLIACADTNDRTFAIKLSNTLAMANHREVLPGDEMYMSGRALYPITISLFRRLIDDIGPDLPVSYSAGADALNVPDLIAAGALPVTVASDLLKPGGYGRMAQYLETLAAAMRAAGARDLETFTERRSEKLAQAAERGLRDVRYTKTYRAHGIPRVTSPLEAFDCIEAPCIAQCAVYQDIPDYTHWIAIGDDDRALAAILHRNPLPGTTGHVCNHLCQTACTRNAYDQSVAIRRLKRFAVEHGDAQLACAQATGKRVAVIGAGPSGLGAACSLALSGVAVTIFEAKDRPGGMLALAPGFRLPSSVVHDDIARIEALGVTIECNHPIEIPPTELLDSGFDAVYVACGFSRDAGLSIEGIDTKGVHGAIGFLDRVARDDAPELGEHVIVVGAGNTAMDAARTAQRLTGKPSTVVYRRSRVEMTADPEEIADLLAEGNELRELVAPQRVIGHNGRVEALECVHTKLGTADADGRRRPIPQPDSTFRLPASTILLATGQHPDLSFLGGSLVAQFDSGQIEIDSTTGRTATDRVYAGGDVTRGPALIVAACADGRRAAEAICKTFDIPCASPPLPNIMFQDEELRAIKAAKARKSLPNIPTSLSVEDRSGFDPVEASLTEAAARREAARCLQCQTLCDRCIDVCPNRANIAVRIRPIDVRLPTLAIRDGRVETCGEETVIIRQARQILHIDDLCNECGNCATFCTHPGKPFLDKPRLFLDANAFAAEDDNAYTIRNGAIVRRHRGMDLRLERQSNGTYQYRDAVVTAQLSEALSLDWVKATSDRDAIDRTSISLRPAIEMAVLLHAIEQSATYLPWPRYASRSAD